MNVYNRATGWGTFVTLVLFAAVMVLDIWLMEKLPSLQHGLKYALLQISMVGVLLKGLWLIFGGGSSSTPD